MEYDDLRRLAGQHRISVVTLEKDYAVTILLSVIAQFTNVSNMTFKGGTALKKIYILKQDFQKILISLVLVIFQKNYLKC